MYNIFPDLHCIICNLCFALQSGLELGGSVTSVHPLLLALDAACWRDVTADASPLRAYVMGVIRSEHLSLRGVTPPAHAHTGMCSIGLLFGMV